jgi:hypothetical protein
MKEQEYKDKLKELEEKFIMDKKSLAKEYAFSNALLRVGENASSNTETIKIDHIKYSMGSFGSLPEVVYYGVLLTKKGEPNKRGERAGIHQSHLALAK